MFFNDQFFWAFISMFGLVGCGAVVSGSKSLELQPVVAVDRLGRLRSAAPELQRSKLLNFYKFQKLILLSYRADAIFLEGWIWI